MLCPSCRSQTRTLHTYLVGGIVRTSDRWCDTCKKIFTTITAYSEQLKLPPVSAYRLAKILGSDKPWPDDYRRPERVEPDGD